MSILIDANVFVAWERGRFDLVGWLAAREADELFCFSSRRLAGTAVLGNSHGTRRARKSVLAFLAQLGIWMFLPSGDAMQKGRRNWLLLSRCRRSALLIFK